MARLSLRLNGEELLKLNLESGHEYIAGRANDCDIILPEQRGISRQHLKFYDQDGVWVCETLSKFIQIQRGAESMNVLRLDEASVFIVTPFEFSFEPTPAPAAKVAPPVEEVKEHAHTTGALITRGGGSDATIAGQGALVPYVRIIYPNSTDDVTLKLEGQLWLVGRDGDCEIPIDSPNVSRKHFELQSTPNGYFVTDLGSSNGTKLNGRPLIPHEPTPVVSGDEMRVMNVQLVFEVRDAQFAGRMNRLPAPAGMDPFAMAAMNWPMAAHDPRPMIEYREQPQALAATTSKVGLFTKLLQNKVRLAIVALVLVGGVIAMLPDKPAEDTQRQPAEQTGSPAFEKLTKEQKFVIKDSFNLARTLYTQGKYSLCLTELAKIHELLPVYENSTELQSFCEQGRQLQIREADAERMKRERERIENQVLGYVEVCKAQLGPKASVDDTRQCLNPAIELAPEHPLVVEMLHSAQIHEEEQKFMDQQKHAEDAKSAKGRAHFERAMAVYKTGNLLDTVEALKHFVNTPYPHLSDLKEQATRKIASVQKEIKQKVDTALQQCDALGQKSQWRDGYKACDTAVKEDPENEDAKKKRGKMLTELRREMKAIYEDSVLEESLGNVDSAKEKWKKIIQEDLSFDDYTLKSKSKLSKYGVEL